MLVQLLYCSSAVSHTDRETIAEILQQSCRNNPRAGITGVLCFTERFFIQLLEGGRPQVNALYARLITDPRHSDVTLLHYSEIGERRYSGWVMGQVDLEKLNPATLLRYSASAAFDPYLMPGTTSLALVDELLLSASVLGGA